MITCENCKDLFRNEADLELHMSTCDLNTVPKAKATMVDVSKEDHINEVDEAIKHNQDTVNNNLQTTEGTERLQSDMERVESTDRTPKDDKISLVTQNNTTSKRSGSPTEPENEEDGSESNADLAGSFTQNHVTLEALQNTKVAVAQFAANALAAGVGNGDNEAALKDLAVLHSTLFQLQHQHVFQLQLIQQLQSQLSMNNRDKADEDKDEEMDDHKSHQSEGFSEKRDDEEEEDFGKLEPEVIISR